MTRSSPSVADRFVVHGETVAGLPDWADDAHDRRVCLERQPWVGGG